MGASATVTDDVLCDVIHARLDALIAAIDRRIGAQLDEILHHPSFQRMERAWRGLAFVVDRTDFAENIRVELLDCSKDDLARDLSRGEKTSASGLYRLLYTDAVGRHAGEPYGAILADLEIVAREMCLVESESVRTLTAWVRAPIDPAIRTVFELLLRDEARHAAAGRALRALIEERYPAADLAAAQARLALRHDDERRHLREQALAAAVGGPGHTLGARLRREELAAVCAQDGDLDEGSW